MNSQDRDPMNRRTSPMSRRAFVIGGASIAAAIGSRIGLAAPAARARHLILFWMQGGPSQLETFDPKVGTDTAGPFRPIPTSVSGLQISGLLPRVAKEMKHASLIRSMTSREGNHRRATQRALTGHVPGGVRHPTVGSVVAAIHGGASDLPPFVAIGGEPVSAGYLGTAHAPFHVEDPGRLDPILIPSTTGERLDRRLSILEAIDARFASEQPGLANDHVAVRRRAVDLMRSAAKEAFDLSKEPEKIRESYGTSPIGRGALTARRLIEAGVRVVQIEQAGWDTHVENFDRTQRLCADLDAALSSLLADLAASGRLDETLVVWMGEFGRTPRINANRGRDHFPAAYSVLLAGGGLRRGAVVGRTSETGESIAERPVSITELLATMYHSVGISPDRRIGTPKGRPIDAIPDGALPIRELI
jgi:hypothetical protein